MICTIKVTIYTDPGCPFGFNAQRQEAQLLWHYGDGLDITRRMIVLTENSSAFEERGLTREMVAARSKRLRAAYGMPMLVEPGDRLPATKPACKVYVGARIHDSARADLLLRCTRRRAFSDGEPVDELDTLNAAGADAGIASETLEGWLADDQVETSLRDDMTAARSPLPEALALAHRLSRNDSGLRYSTASMVFERGSRRVVVPGFQPFAAYEVAVANVAPDLTRRRPPDAVQEVLEWAPYPLATAEVAELRQVSLDQARQELQQTDAEFTAAAGDGYWSRQEG
jgi:predicted DsbA family dithiol-disulfide isomerase